uniref:Uncharacterized protein n=1 Tax=Meloidogyne enterolobii TaxID=390850 RepID=A0A6V7VL48_MELEN|nr:unnamed protein product [Meloidogyne enterolobii]
MDGMLWRIWEKHGSCGNPVWRSCSTCGQMGANGAWRECGQLCSTWLDNGGIWDPVCWDRLPGSSTWMVVSSTWWIGGGSSEIVEGMEWSGEWMVGSTAETMDGPATMRMYQQWVLICASWYKVCFAEERKFLGPEDAFWADFIDCYRLDQMSIFKFYFWRSVI